MIVTNWETFSSARNGEFGVGVFWKDVEIFFNDSGLSFGGFWVVSVLIKDGILWQRCLLL